MAKVSDHDLEIAIKALSTHILGDLCKQEDVKAIENVRNWLEAEQLSRYICAVARETGYSVATIRQRIANAKPPLIQNELMSPPPEQ